MRAAIAIVVIASLAGCASVEEPQTEPEAPAPEPMPPEPLPEVIELPVNLTPEPQPFWLRTCNWEPFAPSPARDGWMDRRVLHIAHQGAENEAPSATMYALKSSIVKGADLLEIDIHVTSDGEIVVLHDTTVDRTTNGEGAVQDLTLAEIKALDAAYWWVPGSPATHDASEEEYVFRGVRDGLKEPPEGCTPEDFTIPTLREVLEEFPGVMMNIEIKNGPPQGTGYEETLHELLTEFGRSDDTIVASFIDTWTETFRAYNADVVDTSTGTGETAIFKATAMAAGPGSPTLLHEAFQVPIEFEGVEVVTQEFVEDAHFHGMAVHVWTINDPAVMRWLVDIGVDGIMTAESTVLEDILQEKGVAWT